MVPDGESSGATESIQQGSGAMKSKSVEIVAYILVIVYVPTVRYSSNVQLATFYDLHSKNFDFREYV